MGQPDLRHAAWVDHQVLQTQPMHSSDLAAESAERPVALVASAESAAKSVVLMASIELVAQHATLVVFAESVAAGLDQQCFE